MNVLLIIMYLGHSVVADLFQRSILLLSWPPVGQQNEPKYVNQSVKDKQKKSNLLLFGFHVTLERQQRICFCLFLSFFPLFTFTLIFVAVISKFPPTWDL